MKNKKLKIFLCDLTYDTIILVSDTIPINIGFIASYLKKHLKDEIDVELFKYPNEVIKRIKSSPPDMIALERVTIKDTSDSKYKKIKRLVNQPSYLAEDTSP